MRKILYFPDIYWSQIEFSIRPPSSFRLFSIFTYRLTIKFVNSALSINVAIQNHVLANTNAKIKLLTIASLIYNRHQYPWCVHNCEKEEKEKKQKLNDGKESLVRWLWMIWFATVSSFFLSIHSFDTSWKCNKAVKSPQIPISHYFLFLLFLQFIHSSSQSYICIGNSLGSNVSITIDEHQIPWQQILKTNTMLHIRLDAVRLMRKSLRLDINKTVWILAITVYLYAHFIWFDQRFPQVN